MLNRCVHEDEDLAGRSAEIAKNIPGDVPEVSCPLLAGCRPSTRTFPVSSRAPSPSSTTASDFRMTLAGGGCLLVVAERSREREQVLFSGREGDPVKSGGRVVEPSRKCRLSVHPVGGKDSQAPLLLGGKRSVPGYWLALRRSCRGNVGAVMQIE